MKDRFRHFPQPLWLGDAPLENRILLIHAEQGFGDVLQFCRYVPIVEKFGAKIIMEAPKILTSTLSTLPGNFTIIEAGQPLPNFDLHCPMMSLPLAVQTTLETIPASIPYLFVSPSQRAIWTKKLGIKTKPRIGLSWSGQPDHKNDHHRSMPLDKLRPLLRTNLEFHALQTEYRESDEALLDELSEIQDHRHELKDFSDTAALISEMDWVISVDTSVAHLAGAMGKPLLLLLPYAPDFRWLLDRSDSPWYPTATLLRQPTLGDWESVLAEVIRQIHLLS
jgi:hypothetical protein